MRAVRDWAGLALGIALCIAFGAVLIWHARHDTEGRDG